MDHILVIGGTGNIGFPLIEMLSKNKDIKIKVGLHRISPDIQKKFQHLDNLNFVPFDFLDPRSFSKAFSDVNKVFFVRPPQLANPQKDMFPFLSYAKQQKIQQLVFVSLIGVEKNPVTPHHKIEKKIRQLHISLYIYSTKFLYAKPKYYSPRRH